MKAVWKGTVIAQSNDTVVVEGNHYFPAQSLRQDLISPSSTQTTCGWKGLANYYTPTRSGTTPSPRRLRVRSKAGSRSGRASRLWLTERR